MPTTLQRVKTKLRAALIRKLDSNSGLASELCSYSVSYGDWRKLFTELDDYNKVTADDVQRVAQNVSGRRTRARWPTRYAREKARREGAK